MDNQARTPDHRARSPGTCVPSFSSVLHAVDNQARTPDHQSRSPAFPIPSFFSVPDAPASADSSEEIGMSKVWLITGASRGLGAAIAKAALAAGDWVVATGRSRERVEQAFGEGDRVLTLGD